MEKQILSQLHQLPENLQQEALDYKEWLLFNV